ncbi:MAG: SRPBCC family protein [Chloroflexota bacterium]
MIKFSASICIDAPASKVWTALSDLDSIHVWSDSIHRSYCEGEQTRGVNAVRVCELGGNVTVKETVIAWDEGHSFTYTGQGIPLIKRAANSWRVEEKGQQTLVTSLAELQVKGGVLGRVFEPILLLVSAQMGRKSLAAFKYLVEHGKPYEGNANKRLPMPKIC